MDKTVGYPTAIAAKMILEGIWYYYYFMHNTPLVYTGRIQRKGIVFPLTKDIYEPILKELKTYFNPATVKSTSL